MSSGAAMMMGNSFAPLEVSRSPASVSGSSSGSSASTGSASVTVTGGSGLFTYSWTPSSGGISCNSPSSASTGFSATGLGIGESRSGSFACTVLDTVTGQTITTAAVSAYVERSTPALSAGASGSSVGSGSSYSTIAIYGNYVTVSGSGGVPPYSYQFFKYSPSDPASVEVAGANQMRFAANVPPGVTYSPVARCRVSDSIGQAVDVFVGGSLRNTSPPAPALSASVSPSSVYALDTAPSITAGPASVQAVGGVGPYTISWSRVSGVGSGGGGFDGYFSNNFSAFGDATGTFRGRVTDALGQTADAYVTASWTYWQGIQGPIF